MLKKTYAKNGKSCRVTFKIDGEDAGAEKIAVLGDFNEWDPKAHLLKQRKDGTFSVTLSLDAGQEYRFRYLLDGSEWSNDDQADELVPNVFGSRDSLLSL